MAIQSFTLCFNGTSCPIVEGEETVVDVGKGQGVSNKETYGATTGYIPVRLWHQAFGNCSAHSPDGMNGAAAPPNHMGALVRGMATHAFYRPITFGGAQVKQVFPWDTWWSSTNYATLAGMGATKAKGSGLPNSWASWGRDDVETMLGTEIWAVAEHGAAIILDALLRYGDSNTRINLLGHSRGGVTTWICAYYLYAYGIVQDKRVNICALDPVPGPGVWNRFIQQLPANVDRFLGIYAWDNNKAGFTAVVPCPNRTTVNQPGTGADLSPDVDGWVPGPDPLRTTSSTESTWGSITPTRNSTYNLIVTRGGHGTPAGNATPNGRYGKDGQELEITAPLLSRALAIQFLGLWGVGNLGRAPSSQTITTWKNKVRANAASAYDKMRLDDMGQQYKNTWQTIASTVVEADDPRAADSFPTYYITDIVPRGAVPDHYHDSAGGVDKGALAGVYSTAESIKGTASAVATTFGTYASAVAEFKAVRAAASAVGGLRNIVSQAAATLIPGTSDDHGEPPVVEISGRAKWRALDDLGKKYFGA